MKSTTCLHFESPLRKGVERAKLKLKTIFLIGNSISLKTRVLKG